MAKVLTDLVVVEVGVVSDSQSMMVFAVQDECICWAGNLPRCASIDDRRGRNEWYRWG